jgi:hypothetical protein
MVLASFRWTLTATVVLSGDFYVVPPEPDNYQFQTRQGPKNAAIAIWFRRLVELTGRSRKTTPPLGFLKAARRPPTLSSQMLRPDAVFDSVVSGIIFVSCRLRRRPASAENSQKRGLARGRVQVYPAVQ